MDNKSGTALDDLYLSYTRGKAFVWEPRASAAKYFHTLSVFNGSNCTIYLQGKCVDKTGRLLSAQEVCELIDKMGEKGLDHIDGSFVIAASDRRYGVWCATDHSATIPMYYKLTAGELIITTRPENAKVTDSSELDVAGIITALNTGYAWGDLTLLKDWKVLRPGQLLSVDKEDHATIKYYFDPEVDKQVQGFTSPEELLKEIDKALISISSRYKKLLIPLSGGVDSRLITLQCHKLGIPFEAITYVANVSEGDDYDIASRLAKIYNVKHHRWEWSPSVDTIENFKQLCVATGGTNDAFTTYPDGMKLFTKVASEFDCVLRGDHSFGFGLQTDSLFQSAYDLSMNFKDDLTWTLQPDYQNSINLESVFEETEQVSAQLKGADVNAWRHRSRRLTRNPRYHLAIGQLQAQSANVTYPLITRNIVEGMARAEITKRNDKLLAREALAAGSPPDIGRIPHSSKHTWQSGEPLLGLPKETLNEMLNIVSRPSQLSDVINESAIADQFSLCLNSDSGKAGIGNIKASAKKWVKKFLPKNVVSSYQEKVSYPKVATHMIFKRLFAMKVYLDAIQKN